MSIFAFCHTIDVTGHVHTIVSTEANLFGVECSDGWLRETLSKQQVYIKRAPGMGLIGQKQRVQ
jgi:hypothetical protein